MATDLTHRVIGPNGACQNFRFAISVARIYPRFTYCFWLFRKLNDFLAHLINIATKKQNEMKRQNTVKTEEENIPQAKAMFKF